MPGDPRHSGEAITRREFLAGAATAAGCLLGLAPGAAARRHHPSGTAEPGSGSRVVHVHSSQATAWDYTTGWFGEFVSQPEVNKMVNRGLMALTGTTSRAAAWQALIPGYIPGQRVAIKANLNNAWSLADSDNIIDALIEPVNSVVRGLVELGVAESDIWVYDAVRSIPNRFRNGCDFAAVQFSGAGWNDQGFSDTETVTFTHPSVPDQRICRVLVEATYLINMPIMKKHSHAYVTLSFKNHFGTIRTCGDLHGPTFPDDSAYSADYNPLVELYQNPHFADKTVLTIGDGLYASRGNQSTRPEPWVTFGNGAPNSLFFSADPVAIDCVMYDFLEAEAGVPAAAGDYLALAAQAGLGVCEHRDPEARGPGDWYSLIDYVHLDLDLETVHRAYVPWVRR
jgi:uncharacterized protein (DUF362 family)